MPQAASQDSLVAAMMRPEFYPQPPDRVVHKETHISHVFLAGDLVYKLKKPVCYPFLDYSSLAKRHHYLQEELRLNRRLAPSVYLDVLPITFEASGWCLDGHGQPAEHALVMRRLPERRMLRFLLESRQATDQMMRDLAHLLASFHDKAERIYLDPELYVGKLERQWSENIAELEQLSAPAAEQEALGVIGAAGSKFVSAHKDVFIRRAAGGWIRDVHGDLHTEHICFASEGIQIFDCIEFSADLRRCDLASEIGFLSMDLAVHDGKSLRAALLAEYQLCVSDPDMPLLLPFFECYRALVRAKVQLLRADGWNDEAARYFDFAQRLAWSRLKPFVVMICGLTGSGKSTLALALSKHLDLPVYNSDIIRKNLSRTEAHHSVKPYEGIYGPAKTAETYAQIAREAEKELLAGRGVILDATFVSRANRQHIVRLAATYKIPLLVVHCRVSERVAGQRLAMRAAAGTDVSDGRWEIYLAQRAVDEPLQEFTPENVLDLETEAPAEQLVSVCERFLRSRLA